jgi:hypothetical protein
LGVHRVENVQGRIAATGSGHDVRSVVRTSSFHTALAFVALLSCFFGGCASTTREARGVRSESAAPGAVLDLMHDVAARADFDAYFACFAEDAVFLGTDATERWTMPEFKEYCRPYFAQGRGWSYVPRERHITMVVGSQNCAIFDELLVNAKYGTCRGSGVLVRRGKDWRVGQYNLSFPIPNDLAEDVTRRVRAASEEPGK